MLREERDDWYPAIEQAHEEGARRLHRLALERITLTGKQKQELEQILDEIEGKEDA